MRGSGTGLLAIGLLSSALLRPHSYVTSALQQHVEQPNLKHILHRLHTRPGQAEPPWCSQEAWANSWRKHIQLCKSHPNPIQHDKQTFAAGGRQSVRGPTGDIPTSFTHLTKLLKIAEAELENFICTKVCCLLSAGAFKLVGEKDNLRLCRPGSITLLVIA